MAPLSPKLLSSTFIFGTMPLEGVPVIGKKDPFSSLAFSNKTSEQVGHRTFAGHGGTGESQQAGAMPVDSHTGESGAFKSEAALAHNALHKNVAETGGHVLEGNGLEGGDGLASYTKESKKPHLLAGGTQQQIQEEFSYATVNPLSHNETKLSQILDATQLAQGQQAFPGNTQYENFEESSGECDKVRRQTFNGLMAGFLHCFLRCQNFIIIFVIWNQFGVASASVLAISEPGLAFWNSSYGLTLLLLLVVVCVHREKMEKLAQDAILGALFGFLGFFCLFMKSDVQAGEELQSLSTILFSVALLIPLFALIKALFLCPYCRRSGCDGCTGGGSSGGNDAYAQT